jgi:hypothetical protein
MDPAQVASDQDGVGPDGTERDEVGNRRAIS